MCICKGKSLELQLVKLIYRKNIVWEHYLKQSYTKQICPNNWWFG